MVETYDEIRHYLFLVPFIVFLVIESLFFIFRKKESYLNISIIVFVFYLVLTQYGLQAYKYALENNREGKPHLSPITKLGIIVFEPDIDEKMIKFWHC